MGILLWFQHPHLSLLQYWHLKDLSYLKTKYISDTEGIFIRLYSVEWIVDLNVNSNQVASYVIIVITVERLIQQTAILIT